MAGAFLLLGDGSRLLLADGSGALLLSSPSNQPVVGPALLGCAPLGTLAIGTMEDDTADETAIADPFDAIGDRMAQDLIHLVYIETVSPAD